MAGTDYFGGGSGGFSVADGLGDGSGELVGLGLDSGEVRGEGSSVARLAFVLSMMFTFALVLALTFPKGVGDTEALAFVTGPPTGMPCSSLPVGGVAGCTAWLFGSAASVGATD
jgi:hypothetical protein